MFNIPQYPSLLAERVNSASSQRVIEEMREFRSSGVQGGVDDEIARMKAPTWSQIGCPGKLLAPAAKREKKAKREKSAR
jgi:hypothetical protein